ncbi:MAG: ArsA family ATPase [Polyangiaceae bacterium]|nr:ArsA family ATPase [Polyangiaceae bacterium]
MTPSAPRSHSKDAPKSHRGHLKSVAEELGSRRFLFVTGKGGVGKTTICGALALALAARGKRVLVAMCNAKERLSAILGTRPIGHDIVEAAPRVHAVNILPERALEEYGAMVIKSNTVAKLVFDNKYVSAFFRAVPGLYEWSMLGKAWFHTTEKDRDGHDLYDVILFDAPATGHGLDMLRVPKVILDVVPPGVLRRDADAAWAMFRDPKLSGVVVVTLPEEMPATETIELVNAIRNELHLPVLQTIVNGVLPQLFTDAERTELMRDPKLLEVDAPSTSAGQPLGALVAGARRAVRERVQVESLDRLKRTIDLPMALLPFLFDEASTAQGTRSLAKHLGG